MRALLTRHADLALAAVVVAIVGMMIPTSSFADALQGLCRTR